MNKINVFYKKLQPLILRLSPLLVALLLLTYGFAELADGVIEGDTLAIDEFILTTLNSYASSPLNVIFKSITTLGNVSVVFVASTILIVALLYKNQLYKALFVTGAMSGVGGLIIALKLIFARSRPDLWEQIIIETSYSFPSGHATGSFALALTIILIVWNTRWRVATITIGITYVLLIGLSRMYLGVHYPSDIVAGWCIATIWVLCVGAVFNTPYFNNKTRVIPNE